MIVAPESPAFSVMSSAASEDVRSGTGGASKEPRPFLDQASAAPYLRADGGHTGFRSTPRRRRVRNGREHGQVRAIGGQRGSLRAHARRIRHLWHPRAARAGDEGRRGNAGRRAGDPLLPRLPGLRHLRGARAPGGGGAQVPPEDSSSPRTTPTPATTRTARRIPTTRQPGQIVRSALRYARFAGPEGSKGRAVERRAPAVLHGAADPHAEPAQRCQRRTWTNGGPLPAATPRS